MRGQRKVNFGRCEFQTIPTSDEASHCSLQTMRGQLESQLWTIASSDDTLSDDTFSDDSMVNLKSTSDDERKSDAEHQTMHFRRWHQTKPKSPSSDPTPKRLIDLGSSVW